MEENFNSKLGFCLFISFILFLIIGGYFFTQKVINTDFRWGSKQKDLNYNCKIDDTKDYIYFINEDTLSKDADMTYKDVVINIKGEEDLTKSLETENKANKESIMYISKQNLPSLDDIYNYDDLYALFYRDYEVYEFDKYVSLVIKDYSYSCFTLLTFKNAKSYVFNVIDGTRISEDELLKMYNTNMDIVKEKIREKLNSSQVVEDGVNVIDIDGTLNDFKYYSFYVNDLGKLCITYLVKSIKTDYNLSMEV